MQSSKILVLKCIKRNRKINFLTIDFCWYPALIVFISGLDCVIYNFDDFIDINLVIIYGVIIFYAYSAIIFNSGNDCPF